MKMTQDQINEGKLLAKQSIEFALRYTHNCKTVKEVRDAILTLFGDEVDGALRAEMFGPSAT